MKKITLKIDGMMCGMCESHVNTAIRNAFDIKKVSSSHKTGEVVVITASEIDTQALISVMADMGYKTLECRSEPYEKKLGFWKK